MLMPPVMTCTMALHGRLTGRARDAMRPGADEKPSTRSEGSLTHPVAEDPPVVAATASRLRRLFPAGRRLAMG